MPLRLTHHQDKGHYLILLIEPFQPIIKATKPKMLGPEDRILNALPHATKLQGGNFSIGKILGQGGFGITYLGSDSRLHRAVAVKEFFPSGCNRVGKTVQLGSAIEGHYFQTIKAQFLEEARALARFQHRNIVQVLTVFEENNTAYLVMEFLKGNTLENLVTQKGILSEEEAIGYIKQLSAALMAIHAEGIIHRDIKPDNAVVCEDGRVVLIDFGLNKKLESSEVYGTRQLAHTAAFGTSGYAPPEQYSKLVPIGKYTDVYALGATLYFLLTGVVPVAALDRMQGIPLSSLDSINSNVSATVNQAVMKAMEIERSGRPQEAQEFMAEILLPPRPKLQQSQASLPAQNSKTGLIYKLIGHSNEIEAVKFSPDGSVLASAGKDAQVILWNVQTGRWMQALKYQKKLTSLSYSPNGEILCAGSGDSNVLLWEVKSGKLLNTLQGHHSSVNSVAFSAQGDTLVSASKDGGILLWDVASGKEIQNVYQNNTEWVCVDISADGTMVASASYNHVWLWDTKIGSVSQLADVYSGFNCVALSPDDALLMTGADDRSAKIWDVHTGELINNFSKHRGAVTEVAFSQDGRVAVSGSSNGIIKMWDVYSGEVRQTFKQDSWATKIALSPCGRLLAAAGEYDNTIKIWVVKATSSASASATAPLTRTQSKKGRRIENLDDFIELWPAVLKRIKRDVGVVAAAYLYDAKPVLFNDRYAVLEIESEFSYEKAREAARRLPFEQVLNECLATPHRLLIRLHNSE